MDYRKLLGKVETLVLPYFGGSSVDAEGRRLRVQHQGTEPVPGWWRFEVRGRDARPLAPAADDEAASVRDAWRPVRGHLVGTHLVLGGAVAEPVQFLPEEEAPALSVCRARRAWSGELCFEMLDFDGEAEEQARRALEEGSPLRGVKGVAASLRAAFGMALMGETARRAGVPMAALEVRQHMLRVADDGAAAAAEVVAALARERADNERRAAAERAQRDAQMVASQVDDARRRARRELGGLDDRAARRLIGGRVEDALSAAGARYRNLRRLEAERFEVTFEFLGQRFITVVDGSTLGVIDAGICLSGSDREVTLESLPSVIREAVDTRRLVITRR